jgi:NAD(P)-dependent dehydrogenase (short-subunit alcohol dehydrogenase family)
MQNSNNIFSLKGKKAIVIGGGGHLCSTIVSGFAGAGAAILIADLRLEKAQSVAEDISKGKVDSDVLAYEVDASSKTSLESLRKYSESRFGKIDILVNGAGINSSKPFLQISEIEWHDVINSQLTATMLGCQVFGEHMLSNGAGSIINISSASADPALSRAFAYSAAKAGIRNLTQNLGREWAKEGVRVNALRPGFFPTAWNRKNFITKEREDAILNHTPFGRFGETEELIGAAIYLASEASNFVTGSELVVDGGFSAMTI